MSEYRDRRVTVMGLGRHGGGVAAARYLARCGARVTVTDLAGPQQLRQPLAQLADVPIERYSLSGHQSADFEQAELLIVNPAVPPNSTWLALAQSRGIPCTTEIGLLLDHTAARVIAVTGSNGKSSTASMIHHLLQAAGMRAHLGGNIGGSLLDELDHIHDDDWLVLELSSFQLARLAQVPRPIEVAVILNCTPNHLDWHGDFDAYRRAKQHLLALQTSLGIALLGDESLRSWRAHAKGTLIEPASAVPSLQLRGSHQQHNAACAAAVALAVGCPPSSLSALATFGGLPHRLQTIALHQQREFIDDSKSTTPEATCAALAALDRPVWLLAGGDHKGIDLAHFAQAVAPRVAGVACYGACAPAMHAALSSASPTLPCANLGTLGQAFDWCWQRSRPRDIVLLSPACSSRDQYADYVARARDFRHCVQSLADAEQTTDSRPDRCGPKTGSRSETASFPPA